MIEKMKALFLTTLMFVLFVADEANALKITEAKAKGKCKDNACQIPYSRLNLKLLKQLSNGACQILHSVKSLKASIAND